MTAHRRKFEEWWLKHHGGKSDLKQDCDGQYMSLLARWAWAGWEACSKSETI